MILNRLIFPEGNKLIFNIDHYENDRKYELAESEKYYVSISKVKTPDKPGFLHLYLSFSRPGQLSLSVLGGRFARGLSELAGEVGLGGKTAPGRDLTQRKVALQQGHLGRSDPIGKGLLGRGSAVCSGIQLVEVGRVQIAHLRQPLQSQVLRQILPDVAIRHHQLVPVQKGHPIFRLPGQPLGGQQ